MKKMFVLIAALSLIAAPLAFAGAPGYGPPENAPGGTTIGAGAPTAVAAFDRGTGPQDGTGTKARKGQQQGGNGQGSGDRVRKGDGSCGGQGAQQTRKGNRNGGGKGKNG